MTISDLARRTRSSRTTIYKYLREGYLAPYELANARGRVLLTEGAVSRVLVLKKRADARRGTAREADWL